jgi:hypothetical protein
MKRRRVACAVVAATASTAAGLGAGLSSSGTASAATGETGVRQRTVVLDCQGHAVARPRTYVLACGDGNNFLAGLSWKNWGPGLASATGAEEVNDCTPYCAAGHFHRYPVDVVLWGSAPVRKHPGTQHYTRVTLLYPGARPSWVSASRTFTMTLWSPSN